MPAKRALSAALALLLVAAIPVRAANVPTLTVVNINPGASSSYAMDHSESVALNGYLYFSANDGTHGDELWRTNGTNSALVKDINTGISGANDSYPQSFTALGDYLYFRADDGTHGWELWRTNGTAGGTTLVKDINETGTGGVNPSNPYFLTAFRNYLYFKADDGTHGEELWRTDGTTTSLVTDINLNGTGVTDGSYPDGFTALGGYLYFSAYEATNGRELWRTDGTPSGTTMVKNINTGSSGADDSSPYDLTALGDYLYFQATDATHGTELWRTNGTAEGTTLVQDIYEGGTYGADSSNPYNLTALGGYIYFSAIGATNGRELWRTNGSTTTLVKDINTTIGSGGDESSSPSYLTVLGDYLYFRADDGTHGWELWRTDGTEAGTTMVEDINTNGIGGLDASYPFSLTALGDYLYFNATDGTHGIELWRTDGAATERVPFPVSGQNTSCDCYDTNIVAVGGRLYATVYSDSIGHEFAYLDEPTYVLPETNRDGSVWTTALVILAGITAAVSIGLRVRGAKRA
jgi:trimeric autotransporter adhesin